MIARLIDGQFPDYNKVIPPNFATFVTVNTDDFLQAGQSYFFTCQRVRIQCYQIQLL